MNLGFEPLKLDRGMDGDLLSELSIFMKDANDRSFMGVKNNSSSDNIESCELMVMDANPIDLAVSLVEHTHVRAYKATIGPPVHNLTGGLVCSDINILFMDLGNSIGGCLGSSLVG